MKRRSFLAFLGLAPAVAVVKLPEEKVIGAHTRLTVLPPDRVEYVPTRTYTYPNGSKIVVTKLTPEERIRGTPHCYPTPADFDNDLFARTYPLL